MGINSYCKSIVNQLPKLESCTGVCETEVYNCISCNQIGIIYIRLDNLPMVKEYFKKSADRGNYEAYYHLWNMNYYRSVNDFIDVLEQNCNTQSVKNPLKQQLACFALGKAYLKGRGIFGKRKGIM